MSEQNTMSYQDAQDLLVSQIYAPVFFHKLATEYGIQPTTEAEAQECLTLAHKLQQLDEANQLKQANDRTNLVSTASKSLDGILAKSGLDNPQTKQVEAGIKSASETLAKDPKIRNAALLYQDAVRQLMAQAK